MRTILTFQGEEYELKPIEDNSHEPSWNRCDVCGRFISFKEFEIGATRHLLTPDSDRSTEEWETLCKKHAPLSIYFKHDQS